MTAQYFFFDTWPGYFLQALPFALLAGVICGVTRRRKEAHLGRKLAACAFAAYLAGLLCLTIGLELMNIFWYWLLYAAEPGTVIRWFGGSWNFLPELCLSAETAGNFLLFMPFGLLYPLTRERPAWRSSIETGLGLILLIEVVQPVFGRAFDINDILWNTLGVVVSTGLFFAANRVRR